MTTSSGGLRRTTVELDVVVEDSERFNEAMKRGSG